MIKPSAVSPRFPIPRPAYIIALSLATAIALAAASQPSSEVVFAGKVEPALPPGVTRAAEGEAPAAPTITQQPVGGTYVLDGSLTLSVKVTGSPAPTFQWMKDGAPLNGETHDTLMIERLMPFDEGSYSVAVSNASGSVTSNAVVVSIPFLRSTHSIARWWNESLLDAIRKDQPNPPVHARNLYYLAGVFWDTYWAYSPEGWTRAAPVFTSENVDPANRTEANREEALSHAAYTLLSKRFAASPSAARSLAGFRWLMLKLGYNPDFTDTMGTSPAATGNRIGHAILDMGMSDGANEANGYKDATAYKPANDPLVVGLPGIKMNYPSHWQPLALSYTVQPDGTIKPGSVQSIVGANSGATKPFAMPETAPFQFLFDPGAPPRFGSETHDAFVQEALDCIMRSALLVAPATTTIDISPAKIENNLLGETDGAGHSVNPVTGQPYAPNVVPVSDYGKVLAEYWADGPASETPPGHWHVLFNDISDNPLTQHRLGGTGPELSRLEWDVRGYLALGGAEHDAACGAFGAKRIYDSARPISMIRYLASLGQSSDPAKPSYNKLGLPLIPGVIELITAETTVPGGRHEHLKDHLGEIALKAWSYSTTPATRPDWILGVAWVPYQKTNFVTPSFPGYISGHSAFSRAAADVLTLFTGSPYFPGGLAQYDVRGETRYQIDSAPAGPVTLQWATYYDAADQAGESRMFGGIHPSADDLAGRKLGARVGLEAYTKMLSLREQNKPALGLTNLSVRATAGSAENSLILGFTVISGGTDPILVRAIGPTLTKYNIQEADTAKDPSLVVRSTADSTPLVTNQDWQSDSDSAAVASVSSQRGAFELPAGSKDAALLLDAPAGGYTAQVIDEGGRTNGIALAELYGTPVSNLSCRASVSGGEHALIGGFTLESDEPQNILIRAIGPGLTDFGVSNTLSDPKVSLLKLVDGNWTPVATNTRWETDERASLVMTASMRAGAFTVPPRKGDSGLFIQLGKGQYSAVVQSASGKTGVVLLELYHLR